MEEKVDAVDIFDWDYLVQIGVKLELSQVRGFGDAVWLFAYDFTSAARSENQNQMLADWLQRATYLQSAETAEEVLACLAAETRADLERLRRFARQNGVRLRRGGSLMRPYQSRLHPMRIRFLKGLKEQSFSFTSFLSGGA